LERIVGLAFGLIGLGMLAGGFYLHRSTQRFLEVAESAQGSVFNHVQQRSTDGDDGSVSYSYYPEVRFTAQGSEITFKSSVGSDPPAYRIGESVEVLYDPANPHDAKIRSFTSLYLGTLLVSGMGLIFAAVGWGTIAYRIKQARDRSWLLRSGQRVSTKVTGVFLDTSTTVNGRSPYRIASQWQDPASKAVYSFRSDALWYDPSEFLPAQSIDVLIDPNDPGRYQMDLSGLPESR